jgi:hypothetical protein
VDVCRVAKQECATVGGAFIMKERARAAASDSYQQICSGLVTLARGGLEVLARRWYGRREFFAPLTGGATPRRSAPVKHGVDEPPRIDLAPAAAHRFSPRRPDRFAAASKQSGAAVMQVARCCFWKS